MCIRDSVGATTCHVDCVLGILPSDHGPERAFLLVIEMGRHSRLNLTCNESACANGMVYAEEVDGSLGFVFWIYAIIHASRMGSGQWTMGRVISFQISFRISLPLAEML